MILFFASNTPRARHYGWIVPRSRPLLFLDVDGVIGRFGSGPRARNQTVELAGYVHLDVDERMASWLRALDDVFEVVWATSWFEDANGILEALGVNLRWPVLTWTELKLPEILARARQRRFAWVDDAIEFELRRQRARWEEPELDESRLFIQTDPAEGLTESHVQELLAFAGRDGSDALHVS